MHRIEQLLKALHISTELRRDSYDRYSTQYALCQCILIDEVKCTNDIIEVLIDEIARISEVLKEANEHIYTLRIPCNDVITESGDFNRIDLVAMLRKYQDDPAAIQFISDMMEGSNEKS